MHDMAQRYYPNSESKQFSHPRLAALYDLINALGDDGDFWLHQIEKLSPTTIIDFGCGTGLLTCELAERGYQTIGIDPAVAMLNVAKQKPYADRVEWIEGDYEKLRGRQADLLLMTSHVAQFLLTDEEWTGMLRMAYDALEAGGYLMFDSRRSIVESFESWPTEQSRRRVKDRSFGEIEYWCNVIETSNRLARYELHYLFKESGEVVVSRDAILFRSYDEIEEGLMTAGFTIQTLYGDWDRSLYDGMSPEMIFVAQKG